MSNLDSVKPDLEVMLDKKRKIIFDFNAICKVEQITGRNMLFDLSWLTKPSASDTRAIVYAGLLADDPKLTLEDVGNLLQQFRAESIEMIQYAFQKAIGILGIEKKSEDPKPEPPKS